MKYLRATTVSVYMNLQPVVDSLVAIIVGQDVFSWEKPLAAVLVLSGAYIQSASVRMVSEPVIRIRMVSLKPTNFATE